MSTVTELNRFAAETLKDDTSGRVALCHYLKNFCRPDETVTAGLINRFFCDCLQLPHWIERQQELYNDIIDLLKTFISGTPQARQLFSFNQLWNLAKLQLVLVQQPEDLFVVVRNHEQSQLTEAEELRVILDGEGRALAVKRNRMGELRIRVYNSLVRIQGDTLLPLTFEQELSYDSNLELKFGMEQALKTAPHSQAKFTLTSEGVHVQFYSGFAFRQSQELALAALSEEPRIFYPLKRLERLYIMRASDPFYLELIGTLEKAIELVRTHTPGSDEFVRKAFEGGQIAFDQIFPDDKPLFSKLRDLARLISIRPREATL